MGQTVVFTIALDADEVAIEQTSERPPHSPLRDAALTALRERRWRIAALIVLLGPAAAAAATFVITRGEWVTTAFLLAAALVTPPSAAWAGATTTGGAESRAASWLVAGLAGGVVALASIPGVVMVARAEQWHQAGAVPTLAVLALSGVTGAWIGLALANLRNPWSPIAAAFTTVALALAPIGVCAALMQETTTTEQILTYTFTTTYDGSRPAYVCGTQMEDVTRKHTQDAAWVAFASPLAWVVDAANVTPHRLANAPAGTLVQVQAWTRSTRVGPDSFQGYCYQPTSLGPPTGVIEARYAKAGPLGAQVAAVALLVVGVLSLAVVSRRRRA